MHHVLQSNPDVLHPLRAYTTTPHEQLRANRTGNTLHHMLQNNPDQTTGICHADGCHASSVRSDIVRQTSASNVGPL